MYKCFPDMPLNVSGHATRLRTLMDLHMLQQQQHPQQAVEQVMLYAGSGDPDVQLLLSAQELLAATAAETGSFSIAASRTVDAASSDQSASDQQHSSAAQATALLSRNSPVSTAQDTQEQQQQTRQPESLNSKWLQNLPMPWLPGSLEVELVGIVAQRRR
jgi:hypothetical protein